MYKGLSSSPPRGVMRTWLTSYSMTRYGNHQHCVRWMLSLGISEKIRETIKRDSKKVTNEHTYYLLTCSLIVVGLRKMGKLRQLFCPVVTPKLFGLREAMGFREAG